MYRLFFFLTRLVKLFSTRIISLELYLRNPKFSYVLQLDWLIKFLLKFFQ